MFEQQPLREGRQVLHGLFDLTQTQFPHLPRVLHRQQRDIDCIRQLCKLAYPLFILRTAPSFVRACRCTHAVTTRTFPSRPGCTSVIRARSHLVGIVGSSRRHTMSPTCRFCAGYFHFDSRISLAKYSCDHRFQKWLVSFWHRFHLRKIVMGCCDSIRSGKAVKGFPIKMTWC